MLYEAPLDLTGVGLIKLLRQFGYEVVGQTGSHIRIQTIEIQTIEGGEHAGTIPRHDPIKIGTLNNILKNIADHLGMTKEELSRQLFS